MKGCQPAAMLFQNSLDGSELVETAGFFKDVFWCERIKLKKYSSLLVSRHNGRPAERQSSCIFPPISHEFILFFSSKTTLCVFFLSLQLWEYSSVKMHYSEKLQCIFFHFFYCGKIHKQNLPLLSVQFSGTKNIRKV